MPTDLDLTIPVYSMSEIGDLPSFAAQLKAITYFTDELLAVAALIRQSTATGVTDPEYANVAAASAAIDAVIALVVDVNGEPFDASIGTLIP